MTKKTGIKARVAAALAANNAGPLTMSELLKVMDLDNTYGPEVSSALQKLRATGEVVATSGKASSNLGPRWVKKYAWANRRPRGKPPTPTTETKSPVLTAQLPRRVFNF